MSGTQPNQMPSSAGALSQFRFQTPEPLSRTYEVYWTNLAKAVPKTEEQWRISRRDCGFDSAGGIRSTLPQLLGSGQIHVIVCFAECKVDGYEKGVPYSTVRAFLDNPKLTEVMIRTYMNAVVKMIKLLDELYPIGRHRAFELLLYIPARLAHLREYVKDPARFKSYCSTGTPPPEIQGSAVPYVPLLLGLKRPDLSYDRISTALGTRLFHQQQFSELLSALRTGELVPRLPPLPYFTPPLCIIQHFEVFGLSRGLKKKAQESADRLRGFDPVAPEAPVETSLHGYQWSPPLQAVVDETITHLVSLGFLAKGESFRCASHAIHHDSGPLPTPDEKFQVIIPIAKNEDTENEDIIPITKNEEGLPTVSLSHALGEIQVNWDFQSGLLMNQGMSLSTQRPIDYIVTRYSALTTTSPDLGSSFTGSVRDEYSTP